MDAAHRQTDKVLERIEAEISKEYRQAEREIQAKLDDYLARFDLKDKKWQEWVKDGKKTSTEYKQWRVSQIAVGKRWGQMRDTIAQDLKNASDIAKSITKGHMPEVYAINHNYGTYEIERKVRLDTSYTLYDAQSVERLIRDNPDILPSYKSKSKTGKILKYNRKQVQSAMIQSLLQGESILKIATRLSKAVGEKDRKVAIRNARTMTTATENAGRQDSYHRANDMGIETQKQWLATLDGRTRHEHRLLDGQTVDVDKPFEVEGEEIDYPGDPAADPSLIYNCRCTMIASVQGLRHDLSMRSYKDIDNMSYEEWVSAKAKSNPITLPEEKAESISQVYKSEYRRL